MKLWIYSVATRVTDGFIIAHPDVVTADDPLIAFSEAPKRDAEATLAKPSVAIMIQRYTSKPCIIIASFLNSSSTSKVLAC